MSLATKILILFLGLGLVNFCVYLRAYFLNFGNWSDKERRIAFILSNIVIFIAWVYFAFFYK